MHIVHVISALRTGGLEEVVVNLINHTPELEHTLVCVSDAGAWRGRLGPTVRVLALGKPPGFDPALPLRLAWLFRRLRPSIVHSRNWGAFDAIPAAALARIPAVVHDEHGREASDPFGADRRRNVVRRLFHPLVSRFVTVSGDLRRWLVGTVRIPEWKVVLIPNGIDPARFHIGARHEARKALGVPDDALVVGSVGRLAAVKNYAALLDAFADLARRYPEARLLLAGDGPLRGTLTRQAQELGIGSRVRFLGERTDIHRVLQGLDLFVLPSIAEGMSISILEAMATGLPVVATAVGGNSELVEDGVTGRLVPPGCPGALRAAIEAYLDDPELLGRQGKAGRERVLSVFTVDRMADAYRQLYATLAARERD